MQSIRHIEEQFLRPESVRARMVAAHAEGYETLAVVLARALFQAAHGKGAERHATAQPFEQQPMQRFIDLYGLGFALGQAGKKMHEAQRLQHDAAVRELLGAINYIASAIIHMEQHHTSAPTPAAANDNSPAQKVEVWMAQNIGKTTPMPLRLSSYVCCGGDPKGCKGCPRG